MMVATAVRHGTHAGYNTKLALVRLESRVAECLPSANALTMRSITEGLAWAQVSKVKLRQRPGMIYERSVTALYTGRQAVCLAAVGSPGEYGRGVRDHGRWY